VKVTWEKIVDYAGTLYGEDVRRTLFLYNKKHVVIPVPVHTPEVLASKKRIKWTTFVSNCLHSLS